MSVDTFRNRVDEICISVGSAEKLGKLAGLTGHTIRTYLKAGREPSRPNLIAIAKAAGVNLLWLATGEGPKYPDTVEPMPKKDVSAWLREFDELFPDLKLTVELRENYRKEEKKTA